VIVNSKYNQLAKVWFLLRISNLKQINRSSIRHFIGDLMSQKGVSKLIIRETNMSIPVKWRVSYRITKHTTNWSLKQQFQLKYKVYQTYVEMQCRFVQNFKYVIGWGLTSEYTIQYIKKHNYKFVQNFKYVTFFFKNSV